MFKLENGPIIQGSTNTQNSKRYVKQCVVSVTHKSLQQNERKHNKGENENLSDDAEVDTMALLLPDAPTLFLPET